MIIRSLVTGRMISKATKENGKYVGKILEETMGKWEIPEDVAELHLTEGEIQQRIEAAVEEHNKSQESPLQKVSIELANQHEQNELLRGEIKQWEWKCDGLEEENKQWHARIAELRAERQPVEVSAELAEAIDWIKAEYSDGWEELFLDHTVVNDTEIECSHETVKALKSTWWDQRLEIIKRGYTVKPDPLRTRIEEILKEHEDDESFGPVVSAIMELFAEEEYLSPDETWELYFESRGHSPHVSMNEIIENLKEQNGDPDVIDHISTKQGE